MGNLILPVSLSLTSESDPNNEEVLSYYLTVGYDALTESGEPAFPEGAFCKISARQRNEETYVEYYTVHTISLSGGWEEFTPPGGGSLWRKSISLPSIAYSFCNSFAGVDAAGLFGNWWNPNKSGANPLGDVTRGQGARRIHSRDWVIPGAYDRRISPNWIRNQIARKADYVSDPEQTVDWEEVLGITDWLAEIEQENAQEVASYYELNPEAEPGFIYTWGEYEIIEREKIVAFRKFQNFNTGYWDTYDVYGPDIIGDSFTALVLQTDGTLSQESIGITDSQERWYVDPETQELITPTDPKADVDGKIVVDILSYSGNLANAVATFASYGNMILAYAPIPAASGS